MPLGLEVVAEGVETRAQQDILRDLGYDQPQGFFMPPHAGRQVAAGRWATKTICLPMPLRGKLRPDFSDSLFTPGRSDNGSR